jgi:GTP-binding protein EngB required for normal cell division
MSSSKPSPASPSPEVVHESAEVTIWRQVFGVVVTSRSVGGGDDVIVVVVGASGVGKTTFINSLGNLGVGRDDALRMVHFLASKAQEGKEDMQADTQHPYAIIVQWKAGHGPSCMQRPGGAASRRLVLVDTPGLGDAGGRIRDVAHLNTILQAFLRLSHLQCILFLANGTESRYSPFMDYVCQQVLGFFPSTFRSKVGLVLTNTPGDPNFRYKHTPLFNWQPELFVMDNPIKKRYDTQDGQRHAQQVWGRTRSALTEVVAWAAKQSPTQVTKFTDIQQRRDLIATRIDRILQDITHLNTLQEEIRLGDLRINSLTGQKNQKGGEKVVKRKYTIHQNEPCDYYSTWCRIHPIKEGTSNKQACHERCGLAYTPEAGSSIFQGCAAMNASKNCQHCGCGWQEHFHDKTRWVAKDVEKDEVDAVVQGEIDRLGSLMSEEEAAILRSRTGVQKVEGLIELHMREVAEVASELVTLCNGFNLAGDLSSQLSGLEMRIAAAKHDHHLKGHLEKAKKALEMLQVMAQQTAVQARASALDSNGRPLPPSAAAAAAAEDNDRAATNQQPTSEPQPSLRSFGDYFNGPTNSAGDTRGATNGHSAHDTGSEVTADNTTRAEISATASSSTAVGANETQGPSAMDRGDEWETITAENTAHMSDAAHTTS